MEIDNTWIILAVTAAMYFLDVYVTKTPNPLDNMLLRAFKKAWDGRKK